MEFKPIVKKRTYNEAIGINQDYDILIKLFPKQLKLGGEENLLLSNYSKNINNVSINNIYLDINLIKCIIVKMIIKYNFYYESYLYKFIC